MNQLVRITLVVAGSCLALVPSQAWAFAHLWDIHEIYTNHDGSVQFIELRTPATGAPSENFLNGQTIRATSTVGSVEMPPVTFTFPLPNPVGNTNNRHLLVATSTFATHLPSVAPDYNTLPANFFVPNADSVTFVFSAGPDTVTLAGSAIPKDGVNSVTDANVFGVANFVLGTNSPTNFAGATGSLNLPPPVTPTGDYNNNGAVDAADYTVWRDTLGQAVSPNGSGADGDADGMIDSGDYDFWKSKFGDVLGGSGGGSIAVVIVPEPSLFGLAIPGLAMLGLAAIRARSAFPQRACLPIQ